MTKFVYPSLLLLVITATCKSANHDASRLQSQALPPLAADLVIYGDFAGETVPTSTGSFTPLNLNRTAGIQFKGLAGLKIARFFNERSTKGPLRCASQSGPCTFYIHHRQLVSENPRSQDTATVLDLILKITDDDDTLQVHLQGERSSLMKLSFLLAPLKDQQAPAGEIPAELEKEFDLDYRAPIRCRLASYTATDTDDTGCFFRINKNGEIFAD